MTGLETILAYHERTKHHLHRYAKSLGFMDWRNQPDPFRRYEGAPLLALVLPPPDEGVTYDALFGSLAKPSAMDAASISALLYDSLSLSAWKSAGAERWALRVNPSSGNLHPTEAYLLAGPLPGLGDAPGLYHYAPFEHGLEVRAELASESWNDLSSAPTAGGLLLGLSSIAWRESWKYGERAFRYCQHDVGHALAAVSLSAAMRGWSCRAIEVLDDPTLASLLGIANHRGDEREDADTLVWLSSSSSQKERSFPNVDALVDAVRVAQLRGKPNRLSPSHQAWPIIDAVTEAALRGAPLVVAPSGGPLVEPTTGLTPERNLGARALVRARRSAVAMDGRTELGRDAFYRMVSRLMPRGRPFDVLPWPSQVHLMLLVHRVHEVEPGLYALVRNADHEPALRASLDPSFCWEMPAGCPAGLPLYTLMTGDVRELARTVSCHQDIASDGVFAVGMLARFRPALEERGPWFYRRLFWETGIVGQMLYLEAEAAGLRGTGIGCFFDDAFHELLGIGDDAFQSLYHFTVGGAVDDPRLGSHPAYAHREE